MSLVFWITLQCNGSRNGFFCSPYKAAYLENALIVLVLVLVLVLLIIEVVIVKVIYLIGLVCSV